MLVACVNGATFRQDERDGRRCVPRCFWSITVGAEVDLVPIYNYAPSACFAVEILFHIRWNNCILESAACMCKW